ncbi:MAG: hypothetical protein V4601_04065 [Pseudomonadota bacterium]
MEKSEPIIIARYSLIASFLLLIVCAGFVALGILAIVEDGAVSVMAVLIFVLFGGGGLVLLAQLIVFRGRAIQIKDGKIVYHLYVRPRECADIVDVWIQRRRVGALPMRFKYVEWQSRDGKKFTVQGALLSEKAAVVVPRLRAACGLPEDPNPEAPRA